MSLGSSGYVLKTLLQDPTDVCRRDNDLIVDNPKGSLIRCSCGLLVSLSTGIPPVSPLYSAPRAALCLCRRSSFNSPREAAACSFAGSPLPLLTERESACAHARKHLHDHAFSLAARALLTREQVNRGAGERWCASLFAHAQKD